MQFSSAKLVVGVAGSGKTRRLIEDVTSKVRAGLPLSKILVFAASRPLAQELRTQILSEISESQINPQITTMHGWAKEILKRFTPSDQEPPVMLTAPQQEFRLRELLSAFPVTNWPESLRPAVKTRIFARQLREKLSDIRQHGLDPQDLLDGSETEQSLGRFFAEYLDVLDAENALDYTELIHRVRLLLADGAASVLAGEIDTVYVDDYAELDESQIRLLTDLHAAGIGVVAFANPDTSVYGFRGAEPRAVMDFAKYFGPDSERVELPQNMRCASAIARAANQITAKLPFRGGILPTKLSEPRQSDYPGVLRAISVNEENFLYDQLASVLRHAHALDGIRWNDMAVITRAGRAEVSKLARTLTSAGVSVVTSGDELALSQEVAVRPLLLVLSIATRKVTGGEITDDELFYLLTCPIGNKTAVEVRKLFSADAEDSKAVAFIRDLVDRVAEMISQGQAVSNLLWEIWSSTDWPKRLRAAALRNDENSQGANRDLDAVIALFDLAERSELSGIRAVQQFTDEVLSQQIAADTTRESDHARAGVSVLTTHRVLGRQWKLVVVVGLQEGEWPRTVPQVRLFEDQVSQAEQIAAERRAFLLSITRATDQVYLLAANGNDGSGARVSRFMSDVGVNVEQHQAEEITNLSGLVAGLRRAAADRTLSDGLRKAAVAQLYKLKQATDAYGTPLVTDANPKNWWGILPVTASDVPISKDDEPVRLSGSDVEDLLECPRKWLLSRKMNADLDNKYAANLGNVIHELASESDHLDLDELNEKFENTWPEIKPEIDWYALSQHEDARKMIVRLKNWVETSDFELLATEKRFEVDLDVGRQRVLLVGRADRIERDSSGALRIIDFKTGSSTPTKKQAESNVQLGVYQLAARLGAFDDVSESRSLADAHLVYLSVPDKNEEMPKQFSQPSLDSRPQISDVETDQPTWIHELIYQAANVVRSNKFDATVCNTCRVCAFKADCPAFSRS